MFHDVSCLSIHFYHFEATIAWRYDLPYLVARTTMNNLDAHRMRLSWGISSDSRPRSGYQSATFRVKVSKEWCDKMPKWDKCHCKVYVKANYLYTMNQIDWSINPSWNWLQSHTACPQLGPLIFNPKDASRAAADSWPTSADLMKRHPISPSICSTVDFQQNQQIYGILNPWCKGTIFGRLSSRLR